MAFKLRIVFDGLCLLVPNTEESKGMRVLVLDARAPGLASNGEAQVSHIPSIRFNLCDLAPGHKQPVHRIDYNSEESTPRGQWILNGDDLEIRLDGQGVLPDEPLTVLRSHPTRDFSLLPNMKLIYPEFDGVEVRDECLDDDLRRLSDAGLVARLRLKAGIVGAWDGHDGRYITQDEWMFTGTPTRHRQRIAARSFFETEVAGDHVEMFSHQRGHGPVFRPHDGDLLEIAFENQPPAEMMSAKPADPDADYDFELVYRIAKNPPLPLRIPMRATVAWSMETDHAGPSSLAAGDRICPPATYSPSSEAHQGNPNCQPVVYNPNSEAHQGNPNCPPATYNPSREGGGEPQICTPVIFNPSREASGYNGPICSGGVFNPSPTA